MKLLLTPAVCPAPRAPRLQASLKPAPTDGPRWILASAISHMMLRSQVRGQGAFEAVTDDPCTRTEPSISLRPPLAQ